MLQRWSSNVWHYAHRSFQNLQDQPVLAAEKNPRWGEYPNSTCIVLLLMTKTGYNCQKTDHLAS